MGGFSSLGLVNLFVAFPGSKNGVSLLGSLDAGGVGTTASIKCGRDRGAVGG